MRMAVVSPTSTKQLEGRIRAPLPFSEETTMNELAQQNTQPRITEIGMSGLDGMDEATFFDMGHKLVQAEHGLQWAIGDWYNAIPAGSANQYVKAEGKMKACLEVGLNPENARKSGRVSKIFASGLRRPLLSFKHHKDIMHDDLMRPDYVRLLDRAIEGSPLKGGNIKIWSARRLKEERDRMLGIIPAEPVDGFVEKVDALTEAVVSVLPKTAGRRAVNTTKTGLRKLAADMQHEFTNAVEKKVDEDLKVIRGNLEKAKAKSEEEFDRTIKMKAGVRAFMDRDEFMLVRACLHPDRNTHPKADEAFTIFNRLADVKSWGS
jgi:hypothetical protein